MITRSGRPALASVWRNPSAIDSTETSTPTTPAMPIKMTIDVPRRWGRLFRLTSVIWTTWLSPDISAVPGQRVDDLEPPGSQGGRQADGERDGHGDPAGDDPRARAHEERRKTPTRRAVDDGEDGGGRRHAHARADQHQQERLGEDEGGDLPVGEPQGLQNGQLRDSLADRLG